MKLRPAFGMTVAWVLTTISCSLLVDVPDGSAGGSVADASHVDGDGAGDSAAAPPTDSSLVARCDLSKPFGAQRSLKELNLSAHEVRPTLSADERILIYTRAGWAIYEARRAEGTGVFTDFADIVSPVTDPAAALTPDGLTLYYAQASEAGANHDIFRARRSNLAGAFPKASPLANDVVNGPADERDPFVVANTLLFTSNRGGDSDLFEAPLDAEGKVGDVRPVDGTGVNLSPGNEVAPVLSGDRLRLYFASDRPFGKGGFDMYVAVRPSVDVAFLQPMPLEELNDRSSELPGWVSPDGCRIYFTSNREDGGAGASDIWFAEKPSL